MRTRKAKRAIASARMLRSAKYAQRDSGRGRHHSRRTLRRSGQGGIQRRVSRNRARHQLQRTNAVRRAACGARCEQSRCARCAWKKSAKSRAFLQEFSRLVGADAAQIETNIEMLPQLDLLVAKARVAQSMDARAPELIDGAALCGQQRTASAARRARDTAVARN